MKDFIKQNKIFRLV